VRASRRGAPKPRDTLKMEGKMELSRKDDDIYAANNGRRNAANRFIN